MAVLAGHMWGRYSQQADASGLERYLGAYVVPASKESGVLPIGRRARPCSGSTRSIGPARLKFSEPAIGGFPRG